jgi:hypothetical protein
VLPQGPAFQRCGGCGHFANIVNNLEGVDMPLKKPKVKRKYGKKKKGKLS